MATQWFCKVADQESGPYSSKQLKQLAAQGRLKPDDPVKPGSDGQWVPAGWVDGLFGDAGNGSGKASKSKAKPLKRATPLDSGPAASPPQAGRPPSSPPTAGPAPGGPVQAASLAGVQQAPMAPAAAPTGYPHPGVQAATPSQPAASAQAPAGRAPASRSSDQDETPAYLRRRRNSNAVIIAVASVVLLGVATALGVMLATRSHDEGDTPRKAGERTPAAEKPEKEIEWVDVSQGPVEREGLRISVAHAWVGPNPWPEAGGPHRQLDKYLFVQVRIDNASQGLKKDYKGWMMVDSTKASDGTNEYTRQRDVRSPNQIRRPTAIYPGKSLEDILVFQPPVSDAADLRLTLTAAAFDGEGKLHLKIPAAMVKSEPPEGLEVAEGPKVPPRPASVDPLFQDLGPERPPLTHPGTSEAPQPGPSQPGTKTPDEPPDIRDLIRKDVEEHGGGSKIEPKGGPDFSDIPGPGKVEPGETERPKEPVEEPPAPKKSNPFE